MYILYAKNIKEGKQINIIMSSLGREESYNMYLCLQFILQILNKDPLHIQVKRLAK